MLYVIHTSLVSLKYYLAVVPMYDPQQKWMYRVSEEVSGDGTAFEKREIFQNSLWQYKYHYHAYFSLITMVKIKSK